jgi:hypothetical protein
MRKNRKETLKTVLCDCEGSEIENTKFFGNLPLEDGQRTACEVFRCKRCGRIGGFPKANLEDAIKNGTPETKEALRMVGVPVDQYLLALTKKEDKEVNPSRRYL